MFELIDAIEQAIRNDNKVSALASLNTLREKLRAERFHQEPSREIEPTAGTSSKDEIIQLGTRVRKIKRKDV